jgi:uncharacterized surface protein with fasciclin (FAS1) repeats
MKKNKTVTVRYVGLAGRRIVNEYKWNAGNGFVQEVTDRALVETLRADGDFEVMAPDVPAMTDEQEGE